MKFLVQYSAYLFHISHSLLILNLGQPIYAVNGSKRIGFVLMILLLLTVFCQVVL